MRVRKIQVKTKQLDQLIEEIRALPDEPVGDHLSEEEFVSYSMELLSEAEVQRVNKHLASCPDCAEQMEETLEFTKAWRGERGEQRLAKLQQQILEKILPQEYLVRLAEMLRSPDYHTQQAAMEEVEKIGSAAATSEILACLDELLHNLERDVRRMAAKAIRHIKGTLEHFIRQLSIKPGLIDITRLQSFRAATEDFSEEGQTEDGMLRWYIVREKGNLIFNFESNALELEGVRLGIKAEDFQLEFTLDKMTSKHVGAEDLVITREELEGWPEEVVPFITFLGEA